jgi:hypothetical protein
MLRSAPQYSLEDRKVIKMFKDEYGRMADTKEWDVLLRTKIFPSMFNHWKTPLQSLTEEEKSGRLKVSTCTSV